MKWLLILLLISIILISGCVNAAEGITGKSITCEKICGEGYVGAPCKTVCSGGSQIAERGAEYVKDKIPDVKDIPGIQ